MALSASPRKVVPLATGDDWKPSRSNTSGPGMTKRVFFCGVVVEGSENGRRLSEGVYNMCRSFHNIQSSHVSMRIDVQDLIVSLGDPLSSDSNNSVLSSGAEPCLHEGTETVSTTISSCWVCLLYGVEVGCTWF